jgi:hypothetical protein
MHQAQVQTRAHEHRGDRSASGMLCRFRGDHRRRARVLLVILVILIELSAVVLPVLARTPARAAAAIIETRMRAAPDPRAEPILRLTVGATLTVHGKPENGWYRARRGQLEGFVLSGDVATVPIPPGSSDPTEERALPGETIDEPASVDLAQRASDQNRRHKDKGNDRGRNRTSESALPLSGEIVVAADLNLRASPSPDAPVVTVIPRRSRVEATGAHQDGFVELLWDGGTGWALGRFLAAGRPAPTRNDRDTSSWSQNELIEIIYEAADRYGQPREDMLRVAHCESDLVPTAVNRSGGSYGLFQFKPSTWLGTPFAEFDIFDPRASANAAAWMWSVGRRREWVCQ